MVGDLGVGREQGGTQGLAPANVTICGTNTGEICRGSVAAVLAVG